MNPSNGSIWFMLAIHIAFLIAFIVVPLKYGHPLSALGYTAIASNIALALFWTAVLVSRSKSRGRS